MRWGAMLVVLGCLAAGPASADDASPTFGGAQSEPFQIAVNPATGQPLVVTVPSGAGSQASK
jgi:hypothetical protein